jgi:hypothetical protein
MDRIKNEYDAHRALSTQAAKKDLPAWQKPGKIRVYKKPSLIQRILWTIR